MKKKNLGQLFLLLLALLALNTSQLKGEEVCNLVQPTSTQWWPQWAADESRILLRQRLGTLEPAHR